MYILDEVKRENYLFDCLWAMATDMRFLHDKKPSLQRWSYFASPVIKVNEPVLTKEAVKGMFDRLRSRKERRGDP